MPDDRVDNLLNSETEKLEQFSREARETMQELMDGLERDFRSFLDKLLRVEIGRYESTLRQILKSTGTPPIAGAASTALEQVLNDVFGQDDSSLTGSALSQAFRTTQSRETTVSSSAATYTRRGFRTSRLQMSAALAEQLGKSQRNH